ncbi:exodeoxyribonuclease V subunit alpha [Nitrincola sp. MINF-07-Sa-05]|uniref:exodeoxyribonuclease V subunit alpha n=1 Tax=Nitrincola salilacus TaxID=3400273 RepID=UPI003918030E
MTPQIASTINLSVLQQDSEALLAVLERWAEAGWLRWLDVELARFLSKEAVDAPPLLLLAAALTSHQNGRGHVCLDLQHCLDEPERALSLPPEGDQSELAVLPGQLLSSIQLDQWLQALSHPLLITHTDTSDGTTESNTSLNTPLNTPLVLSGSAERPLLYLRRFWRYEQQISQVILSRLEQPFDLPENLLKQSLNLLFESKDTDPNWQMIACALAARSAFAVITGGPGTGKTTTVVKLLALLQHLALSQQGGALRIRLAAPTGKAAARLNESIAGQVQGLNLSQLPDAERIRDEIPTEVTTLHRLLGPIPGSRFFRHHAGNPLPVDLVVVDEASMVDVEMMANLLSALAPGARLILLGDKDQLASVEAGAVLGSLCQRADAAHYSPVTAQWLQGICQQSIPTEYIDPQGTPRDQVITMLRHSYRFGSQSGIGTLARRVNTAANTTELQTVFNGQFADLQHLRLNSATDQRFEQLITDPQEGYGTYLTCLQQQRPADTDPTESWDNWARAVLKAHGQFQLLAALRMGPWGVEQLNERIASALQSRGLIDPTGIWYTGRPVMITRNDYSLGLMNGDIGMTLEYPRQHEDGRISRVLRVAFPAGDGTDRIRWILPGRLQAAETVFAMTVHKSQGSEFRHTALLLPDHDSPILTRELIYTGITRAREKFTLIDSHSRVLANAVASSVYRVSGLF